MDHTLPKRSLFEIFDRTNQALILLHSATVMRGRAVARPKLRIVVAGDDGQVDDAAGNGVDGGKCWSFFCLILLKFEIWESIRPC